ncbi:type II toxin-antitoxin system VapC family toxin [Prosthecochloris sp. HL-130-GSB]|jgi:toxin FitB|uniref:type II toxin-antitoxin system VapC family toxin n=1 Tax=Prosthecochloris sp. HL-130-GSB TaxID=1974213 RepID=UPI000A1C09A3|nr:type II toxin-antitoxin system VapC family toxin [Prosthecochloris sp. HL-130-GSB]ARM31384.1 hypothetical protein B9H02_08875 [Prosthecochloris sp. HL-130-GSB]
MKQAFLLDTNVISAFMRPGPNGNVVQWFDEHRGAQFYISAITKAEILVGIGLLPEGRRREKLAITAGNMFDTDFASRCLSFDERSAAAYAEIVAQRTRSGTPVSTEDAQIASIAIVHNLPLVTRNTKDFSGIGKLQLHNPWL